MYCRRFTQEFATFILILFWEQLIIIIMILLRVYRVVLFSVLLLKIYSRYQTRQKQFKLFGSTLLDAISREITASTGDRYSAISFKENTGGGGGGGARVGSVVDKHQQEYFVKSGNYLYMKLFANI